MEEGNKKQTATQVVKEIKRRTRRKFTAEEKIRIVLEGLRGEESIATICRREGINPNLYYKWSKDFLEAGRERLNGDTKREAASNVLLDLQKYNPNFELLKMSLIFMIPIVWILLKTNTYDYEEI